MLPFDVEQTLGPVGLVLRAEIAMTPAMTLFAGVLRGVTIKALPQTRTASA